MPRPSLPPRLLLLAMYPLDEGLWGATARITQLRDELAQLVRLDVVSGRRWTRGARLFGYLARGRLRGLKGIYVENSTILPGPADLAFLALGRLLGVPVLTYVRDAQQLFGENYVADSLKRRVARLAFLPLLRLLMAVSTRVAFPSRGLAAAVLGKERGADATLLPPGARLADAPAVDPAARALLFVGGLRYPVHGGDILLEAVELARGRGHQVELICVSRPGEEPPGPLPAWLRLARAEGRQIDALLPEVRATVTPRRKTPYSDLGVPIKVLEYLGYARPLLVTDTVETAAIVRSAGCGLVVPDSAEGLADGIGAIASASPDQLAVWAEAARRAAEANSWRVRAEQVLALLELRVPIEEGPG